jgi:putative membrane protein
MESLNQIKAEKLRKTIIVISIALPLAVAALFGIKLEGITLFRSFPGIYAGINALTALCLVCALMAIKRKKVTTHMAWIRLALLLSFLFLIMYVLYHITSPTTYYGDSNSDGIVDILEYSKVRNTVLIYYLLLFTHILLSIAVVPLVLFSYLFARTEQIERHKKWVRFAFPIWLYVAVSGVVVYFFIAPYYVR